MSTTTFFCNLSVPILVGEDRYKYVPIVGVFRSIPFDQVDEWVMDADGARAATANSRPKSL